MVQYLDFALLHIILLVFVSLSINKGAQWQTVSLCSTGQSPLKAVLINYAMNTGPFWSPQNVAQYHIVR